MSEISNGQKMLLATTRTAKNHLYEHSDVVAVLGMQKDPATKPHKLVLQFGRDIVELPDGSHDGNYNPDPLRLVLATISMSAEDARSLAQNILQVIGEA